jgi:hypothetical protein
MYPAVVGLAVIFQIRRLAIRLIKKIAASPTTAILLVFSIRLFKPKTMAFPYTFPTLRVFSATSGVSFTAFGSQSMSQPELEPPIEEPELEPPIEEPELEPPTEDNSPVPLVSTGILRSTSRTLFHAAFHVC